MRSSLDLINFLVRFFKKEEKKIKQTLKELALYSSPILLLVLWFSWHKIATGWMFTVPGQEGRLGSSWEIFFLKLKAISDFLFLGQGRFIISFSIIVFLFFIFFRKKAKKALGQESVILLFLIIVFTPLAFSGLEFLHRYIVFALPFFYIFFCYLAASVFFKNPAYSVFVALLILLPTFYFNWNSHRQIKNWYFPPLEENLEYLDIIKVGKFTSKFLEKYYPDAQIYTEFPTNYMLSESWQHYVKKPLNVRNCKDYKKNDKADIVVFHYFTPNQGYCLEMIKNMGFYNLITFTENGKSMEIYKK